MRTHFYKFLSVLALTGAAWLSAAEDIHWTWCGWGGGGWYWCAAFDWKDANTLYMGGDVVGIYKTTDGGRSWSFANRGLQNYGVYSLAVSKSDSQTLYALTENGVAASFDGGASWKPCKQTFRGELEVVASRGRSVHALAIDPANPRIVLAGGANGRLVRSTDGGENWTDIDYLSARPKLAETTVKAVSGAGFARVMMDSPQGNWANYVRIQKFISQQGEDWSGYETISARFFLPPEAPQGMQATIVVQSGDGWTWKEAPMVSLIPGQWTTVTGQMPAYADTKKCHLVHLVVRPQGKSFKGELDIDEVVLKGAEGTKAIGEWDGPGLENWVKSPDKNTQITLSLQTSQAPTAPLKEAVSSITICTGDPRLVFLCNVHYGLFRSTDGGMTWSQNPDTPKTARHIACVGDSNQLFYGAFGKNGVQVSRDGGITWTKVETPNESYLPIRDIAVNPQNPQIIHAVVEDGFSGYTMMTLDGGKTWTKNSKFTHDHQANPTLPASTDNKLSGIKNLVLSPVKPERLFIAANWSPCISEDHGAVWRECCQGADITCFHDVRFLDDEVYAVAMDEGSFVSSDNGAHWQALSPLKWAPGLSGHQWRILPQRLPDGRKRIISTVSPWAHGHDFPAKVIVSEDGGKTFVEAKGLPDYRPYANTMWGEGHPRALAVDQNNPDVIYLGLDGDPEGNKCGGGIFVSTNGGKDWKQLENQPGSRRMFYGLSVDPTNSQRIYWGACGSASGVYVSENGGADWQKSPNMNDWIFNLETAPSGVVYAAGSQLHRSDDFGKSWRSMTKFKGVTVIGIAIDPEDEERLWISTTTWNNNAAGGIYESTDGGQNWTDITGDIPYVKPLIVRYNARRHELWAAGVAAFRLKRE